MYKRARRTRDGAQVRFLLAAPLLGALAAGPRGLALPLGSLWVNRPFLLEKLSVIKFFV